MSPYLAGDPNSRPDVRASKHRDAETERVLDLPQNRVFVVGFYEIVNDLDIETRLYQGRREAKQGERSSERRTVVRWVKEDDFVLRSQSVQCPPGPRWQLILLSFVRLACQT